MWRARFGRGFGPIVRQTTKWMNEWNTLRHPKAAAQVLLLSHKFAGVPCCFFWLWVNKKYSVKVSSNGAFLPSLVKIGLSSGSYPQTVWWSHPPASLLLQKLGQTQVPKQLITRNGLAWIGTESSMCVAEIVALGKCIYVRVKKQSCPCASHKAIWRSGGVGPRIPNLVSTQRLLTSFSLIFSKPFVVNIFHSKKKWATYDKNVYYLHVKYPLMKHKTCIFWTEFLKILKYKISWKSVQWEPSYFMRTEGQTWLM
jgi:hypothetical protein